MLKFRGMQRGLCLLVCVKLEIKWRYYLNAYVWKSRYIPCDKHVCICFDCAMDLQGIFIIVNGNGQSTS